MSRPGLTRVPVRPGSPLSVVVAILATVCAMVLVAGLVSLRGNRVAELPTELVSGTVTAEGAGGARLLRAGDRVPADTLVRTAEDDEAVLATGDRRVHLRGALTVLDGARQRLEAGALLVDATDGPRLLVGTDAAEVVVPRGSLARLERGALVRVAAYEGRAGVQADGQTTAAQVPRLHQVQVPADALPGRVTPLALTPRDRWEAERLPDVVDTDDVLTALAEGLDDSDLGAVVLAALPAVPDDELLPEPRSRGERAMAYALAHAAGNAERRYRDVVTGRELGGSWGVLAALVEADGEAVRDYLDRLLPAPVLLASSGSPQVDAGPLDLLDVLTGRSGPGTGPVRAATPPAAGPGRLPVPAAGAAAKDRPESGRPTSGAEQTVEDGEDRTQEAVQDVVDVAPRETSAPSAPRPPPSVRLPTSTAPPAAELPQVRVPAPQPPVTVPDLPRLPVPAAPVPAAPRAPSVPAAPVPAAPRPAVPVPAAPVPAAPAPAAPAPAAPVPAAPRPAAPAPAAPAPAAPRPAAPAPAAPAPAAPVPAAPVPAAPVPAAPAPPARVEAPRLPAVPALPGG